MLLEGRKGTITGEVVDAAQTPVDGSFLRMTKEMSFGGVLIPYRTGVVTTDSSGRFTIETFYGTYTLAASRTDAVLEDPTTAEVTETVTIGAVPIDVTLTLTAP